MREMMERLGARFSRGSIRYVMFASFTISALVAVLLTGMTLYARFSRQMDEAIQEENQILVSQVNQSLSTYLRDMIRLSDALYYNVVKNTDLEREEVGEEIRLRRTSLPRLLHQLAADRGPACRAFCEDAAGAMDRGEPLEFGWRLAAETLPLAAEDRSALLALGESLQGDEEQICKAIELARDLLAESLEETRSRRAETERRAAALWLSAGALVVITLI